MEALLVFDNRLCCCDQLVSHHGVYSHWKGDQTLCSDTSDICDTSSGKELGNVGSETGQDLSDTLSLKLNHLHLSESCDTTLKTFRDRLPLLLRNESQSQRNCLSPYSLLEASPGDESMYQFETVLLKDRTSDVHISSDIVVLSVDCYLASAVTYSLTRTDTFWIGFSKYVIELCRRGGVRLRQTGKTTERFERVVAFLLQRVKKEVINYPWCNKLEILVMKKIMLEEMMAWLSTLGGGYSSLGDFQVEHADTAGRISVQQLKVALELGDTIIQCKCRLFFALSLMQKGKLSKSKQLLRNEFAFIKKENVKDDKLRNMCVALWMKLKYAYEERRNGTKILKGLTNGTKNVMKTQELPIS